MRPCHQTYESLHLALDPLLEALRDGVLDTLDNGLGSLESTGFARDALAEVGEQSGILFGRFNLLIRVPHLNQRTAFLNDLFAVVEAARQQIIDNLIYKPAFQRKIRAHRIS